MKNNILLKIFFVIISVICSYNIYLQYLEIKETREFFNSIKGTVNVNEYIIYGNNLNIKGKINYINKPDDVSIVLKNLDDEREYPLSYTYKDGNILFETSKYINKGIDLEKLIDVNHYIFIKIKNNKNIEYYSLKNDTIYENIEYFSLTKNNKNYKIKLYINEFQVKKEKIPYFKLKSNNVIIDGEFFDIIIDPGHGGKDPGAISLNKYYREADLNLEVSKKLKKSLEKIGLKVKLTREEDVTLPSYGLDGRAVIPNKYKAKLLLSIHLNSSEKKNITGGVEIYTPSNIDYTLASLMADNIVDIAKTNYSANDTDKIKDGVYVRTFNQKGIKEAEDYAIKNGYEPYNITTTTPALYMLRETGGIMTNAYIDGRNKDMDVNLYYNSNVAVESYLLELGYINNNDNLSHLLNNMDLYVDAITNSVKDYYGL